MRRALFVLLATVLLALIGAGAGFLYIRAQVRAPGPRTLSVRIVIEPGSSVADISRQLEKDGLVRNAFVFRFWARYSGRQAGLRAGEYDVPARASVEDILALLESGRTLAHKLTVPEGTTSAEVLVLLRDAKGLRGNIDVVPADGEILPETYFYSRGERRDVLLRRMTMAMRDAVREVWARRPGKFILKTPEQMVTLASLVEKETALPVERPMIAGVFLNRLKRGMRLQSDPTVVYALTRGAAVLGRELSRSDLKIDSPYNTYRVKGLPPGPIANPGIAALRAVIRAAKTQALYFVADGTGGHVFARTLKAHNRNVARWRRFQRQRSQGNGN